MIHDDIIAGRKAIDRLLDLAERYFLDVNSVGEEFAQLTPTERDIYLHLKDHLFTAASSIHATETPDSPRIIEEGEGEEAPPEPPVRIKNEWED